VIGVGVSPAGDSWALRRTRRKAAVLSAVVACAVFTVLGCPHASSEQPVRLDLAGVNTALSAEPVGPSAAAAAALVDIDCHLRDGGSSGTGIVIGSDGVVVTNNHVVTGALSISATALADGHRYPVVVVGRDPVRDIAVIKLVGALGLPVAPLGDSDRLKVGDPVAALGNAGGRGGPPSITSGAVIALDRSIVSDDDNHNSRRLRGMIEVSAAMPQGDSGGALVGPSGVIGMNTAESPNSGFAIPINVVLNVASRWVDGPSGTEAEGEPFAR
jgi:S1-C subfamily serine protease